MFDKFPNKEQRELWNVNQAITKYNKQYSKNLIIFSKQETPDFVCIDTITKKKYGIEVTEVYLSDRSVPDNHIPLFNGRDHINIYCNFESYGKRITEQVHKKIIKAEKFYEKKYPLILSIYLAEHYFVLPHHIEKLISDNSRLFDNIYPFEEIILLNLANNQTCFIRM